MPSYTLTNNASDIDSAISRVVAAETIPSTGSQNMVTSGGVKNYVDTEVSTVNSRIDGVDADIAEVAASIKVATYSRTAYTTYSQYSGGTIVQLSESYNPNNIGAVVTSGAYDGGVQVSAGTYLINFTGSFNEHDNDVNDYYTVILRSSGTNLHAQLVNEVFRENTTNLGSYSSINFTQVLTVPEGSTKDINIYLQRSSGAGLISINVFLTLTKLA